MADDGHVHNNSQQIEAQSAEIPTPTWYAEHGIPVFPCRPDKSPWTPDGWKNATTDAAQIQAWWAHFPDALIGIPGGKPSGYFFLDVDMKDGKDGEESLSALCNGHDLPDTVETLTPSGGRHYWFKYPEDAEIRCSAGKIGVGLDVRAAGGYVCAPGAGDYEFEASSDLVEGHEVAEAPDWLLEIVRAPPQWAHREGTGGIAEPLETVEQRDDLRAALFSLDADDRDTWIAAGMALKTLPEENRQQEWGLETWWEWSQTSEKCQPHDRGTWDTLDPRTTHWKALFVKAAEGGWVNPRGHVPSTPEEAFGAGAQDPPPPIPPSSLEIIKKQIEDAESRGGDIAAEWVPILLDSGGLIGEHEEQLITWVKEKTGIVKGVLQASLKRERKARQRAQQREDAPALRDIDVSGGYLRIALRESISAMATKDPPKLYRRSNTLVTVAELKEEEEIGGIEIKPGQTILHRVTAHGLLVLMHEASNFIKTDEKGISGFTDPPLLLAQAILHSPDRWTQFKSLIALTACPIIDKEGAIHGEAGYHPDSKLYYTGDAPKLEVPAHVTREQAIDLAKYLLYPFSEFQFSGDRQVALSVILAYLLTLALRHDLSLAPLFGISATCPGAGKGLLVELINLIVRGRDAFTMPPVDDGPGRNEEERKRITTIIMTGADSVHLDNWTVPVGTDSMNAVLTAATWSDRKLGGNEQVTLPARCTWAASGNNLVLRGDMVRRSLYLEIDPGVENPEQRIFWLFRPPNDVKSWVISNRKTLLSALFGILRGYRQAGCPGAHEEPLGRFEEWSAAVAGPIRWLGYPNPTKSQDVLREADPVREKLGDMLRALEAAFGLGQYKDTGEMVTAAQLNGPGAVELREALDAICRQSTGYNKTSLGLWLKRHTGRILAGRKIVHEKRRRNCYAVVKI